jgi:DNA-binding PadR family transcriptional regulator
MPKYNISNAELAILSLVAEQSVYGYQIGQIIVERGMREWTEIGFSSIYYLLNKLEKKGWVSSQMQNAIHQGLARRVFSITSDGLKCCQLESLKALSEPRKSSSHFQLGLVNLPLLGNSETLNSLKHYEDTLIHKKQELEHKKFAFGNDIPTHVEILFDYSLHQINAEISWVNNFVQKHK